MSTRPTKRTSFDEFTDQMESLFGKKLTLPATQAATDFWNHWESFTDLISQRQLSVHVDSFFLSHNFKKYRRYQNYKGGGIVLLVLGLAIVWFFWPIGVSLLVAGIALGFYSNRIRFNDAKGFAEEVMKESTLNPAEMGYARLCSHYIAGIVELVTPVASAHWPQHPSNVITGTRTFIKTRETQQSPPSPPRTLGGHSEDEG